MRLGIRGKLITIFIFIKVIPLILLAWLAMNEVNKLGISVSSQSAQMANDTKHIVGQIGGLATENSIIALDEKSRESIERLTTDTARDVASFLYERDEDILTAAHLPTTAENYRNFLAPRKHPTIYPAPWQLSPDGTSWLPPPEHDHSLPVSARNPDNEKDFHYRPPEAQGITVEKPLYLEMTFIDLTGREKVKVTTTDLLPKTLGDVSSRENTWCRAETYFSELKKLKPGEIYVSEVIGPYLPSPLIGPYTQKRCEEMGIPFEPEKAAYAGKENPVGKRFQGLIRWATPVVKAGRIIGYVTLALDHTHIMEFTDHVVPTEERYSPISDASSGNYAFMWDFKGRNISHPRDYFIVGYDPATGEEAVPWLSSEIYDMWQKSGLTFGEFQKTAPVFLEQRLAKKPAAALTKAGMVGLDGRFLNFAPQCTGWHTLTQYGGSGSFVIFWSNLWKLTTAATIPYYTGMYKNSPRGFGYVTIGANVDEFHHAATQTASEIAAIENNFEGKLLAKNAANQKFMTNALEDTAKKLSLSTLFMILVVILIAIWMASSLTGKITTMIQGIKRFQDGNYEHRLETRSSDEMGQLARAFNNMSDVIQESLSQTRIARHKAEESDRAKSLFLANMSHEIRTPLNAIMGLTDLLLTSDADPTQKKYLNAVKTSSDRLLSVISDILDFSKIEAGKLELIAIPFNLHETLNSVLQILTLKAQGKNLVLQRTISSTVPPMLIGDPNRLVQIIINLVTNGIKFTNVGSVTIHVNREKMTEDGKVMLKFSVIDTGIGISPENQKLIFRAFSQVDPSHIRRFGGTGLGLSISSELATLMGGSIGVSSTPGKGSTFWFTACFGLSGNNSVHDEPENGQLTALLGYNKDALRNIRVLLAEDEMISSMMAKDMLERKGMIVATVENGEQAVAAFSAGTFDIILMDVQMPQIDGFEAAMRIRAQERGKGTHIPIIALTAHAMKDYRNKCLESGMDDYITKPIQLNELYLAIEKLVDRKEVNSGKDLTAQ
ncbi:MAG: response regulator [Proteobacteria bacterium]|nr:response regulator [Pseudomonadota bacterium]MBU4295932.1 response regulator [Pseudomonadota bacterium]MCG2746140.1 ATP-binding protein [Desulfobulbaceae bacterium]